MSSNFLNKKGADPAPTLIEINNIDTICDHCFAMVDKVYYNKTKKTLLVICSQGHEFNREGNWSQILGLEN